MFLLDDIYLREILIEATTMDVFLLTAVIVGIHLPRSFCSIVAAVPERSHHVERGKARAAAPFRGGSIFEALPAVVFVFLRKMASSIQDAGAAATATSSAPARPQKRAIEVVPSC